MEIPFLNLSRLNKKYAGLINSAVERVLHSGNYILGEEGTLFETEFAAYCGTAHCITVANGTDALFLAIKALQLKKGSEVIIAANSHISAVLAICYNGLVPVPVDPDIETYNIDPGKIEEKITTNTSAILVTHLYGRVCQMDLLSNLAARHHVKLIEDCAQAHGGVYKNTRAGNFGNIAAFSFYPTKNLGAVGDGGAVVTNDAALAEMVLRLRNYGFKEKNYTDIKGHNSRLDEIQAAVLRLKLPYLDSENVVRKEIAKKYLEKIKNSKLVLPVYADCSVWHLFVIRTANRTALQAHLYDKGIESKIHYPVPYYRQGAFNEFKDTSLPVSDRIHNEVLSIPLHAALEDDEVDYIIDIINKY